jgi:4,5-dihydroxyphthalate decarboxylase
VSARSLRYRGPRHLDRTVALEVGAVRPAGVDLAVEATPTIDGGVEALLSGDCDLAEIPLPVLLGHVARGDGEIVGLPVFLSRRFPHRYLWVALDSSHARIEDLGGARIGWAPGSGAAAAWTRHLITSEGVEPEYELGVMGGSMAAVLDMGRPVEGETLVEALVGGRLDALATPYPVPPADGGDGLRPLLRDVAAAEHRWVIGGGALPMTTVIAARGEALTADLATAIADAFAEAHEAGLARLRYPGAPAVALPWLAEHLAEIDRLFGGDPYPYGLARNEPVLEAFIDNARALGLVEQPVRAADLFLESLRGWRPSRD